ncbi:hypothetical protein [Arthrobacter sp. B1805]|uniref:hypothetical protein n=1 Tax=Arthrobacter sp. B1805 TaxID=2058892 RepID=UPI0011B05A34|nr:hypothetical protein [Arthrobacter sp. B1805]
MSSNPRNPPPRFATPRNPARQTLGGSVCKVMQAAGNTPMPWQRDALAVACEIDPATGGFWYDTVIAIVLRRAGKTTISRAKLTHRALTTVDGRMIYTAQNRLKALKRLRDDFYLPTLRSPQLKESLAKPRWRGGEEAVRYKTGAELAIDAVSDNSGHGDMNHEGHIDEAYAHSDNTLEGGIQPTLLTVVGSQLWILSAAGNTRSTYLAEKRDIGRALIESGRQSRTCYIEYSAPEDADPNDPETLANTHPAGGHTIDVERVMGLRENSTDLAEWERAWYGWWPQAKAPPRIIPTSLWEDGYITSDESAWEGTPRWALDISPDREWTSIGMAARSTDPEAKAYIELYEHRVGTAGAVDELAALASQFGGWKVAIDAGGGARSLVPDLEAAGFEVVKVPGPERIAACGGFYDDALANDLRYLNDPELNAAMVAAQKHYIGGKAFIFARGRTQQDISSLYAVTFARWLLIETAEDDGDPLDSIL